MCWKYRLRSVVVLLVVGLFLSTGPSPTVGQEFKFLYPFYTAHENGLLLTWEPPEYSLTTVMSAGQRYSRIAMPGLDVLQRAGYPQLPVYTALVGLPPEGEVWLRVTELQRDMVVLPHAPLPAPAIQSVHLSSDSAGAPLVAPFAPVAVLANADDVDFYPDVVAQLGPPQWVRGRRVALLTIYPVSVNPSRAQMEVVRALRLEITFERLVIASPFVADPLANDPFAPALAATLLNPEAATWQTSRPVSAASIQATPVISGDLLKVSLSEPGLYALTYADLLGAGLPVDSLDPRALRLTHGLPRQEIAILVEGEADGVFDPGDRVLFYAAPAFSRFSDTDAYLLDIGPGAGARMDTQSGNPYGLPSGTIWRSARAEINRHYDALYAGRDGDHWYWDDLRQPDRTEANYALWLDAPLPASAEDATLTLWLRGYTDPVQNPDHRVRVAWQGSVVGEITWDGTAAVETSLSVPASLLRDGENQITLSLPGAGVLAEGLWLDAFELTYPSTGLAPSGPLHFLGEASRKAYSLSGWDSVDLLVYEISDVLAPRRVTDYPLISSAAGHTLTLGDAHADASYLVVPRAQIKTPLSVQLAQILDLPPDAADYVIITHPDVAAALAPLIALREAQGLRVFTADVHAIYDTYAAGRPSPEAIHAFLEHIYYAQAPAMPQYVLLVGDGSYDFKDHSAAGAHNLIPPYLADADPWLGETAADNRYVCLEGDDTLPDMLLGRLPVKTLQEAQIVVQKIVRYETEPFPGDWNAEVVFAADDPDHGGDFPMDSDVYAAGQVAAPFSATRHYCEGETSWGSDCSVSDSEALRSSIFSAWNRGALLFQFIGHSSWQQWAAERFFHLDDLPLLQNGRRLPVVLEMTCFTAAFQRPEATLDESLLTLDGGGAVAVWGGTGLGANSGHNRLTAGFHQAFFGSQVERLGAATLAGKLILASTGQGLDLLDTYVLLGDPALKLNRTLIARPHQVYLPRVLRHSRGSEAAE